MVLGRLAVGLDLDDIGWHGVTQGNCVDSHYHMLLLGISDPS